MGGKGGSRGASGNREARDREVEALAAVARILGGDADLIATAEQALDVVRSVARMEIGAVYRLERDGASLVLVAHRGIPPELLERVRIRPVEGTHAGEAVRTGRFVVTRADSHTRDPELRRLARALGYRTQASLPVPVTGAAWGVMLLISTDERVFQAEDVRLLETIARQIGLAVARASLLTETREKSRRLESLMGVARTLTATLSLDEVLQRVVEAAVEVFAGSVARVWLLDDDGQAVSLKASAGMLTSGGVTRFRVGEGLVGVVAAGRATMTVSDVLADPRIRSREFLRAEGIVAFAGIPLLAGDRLLGVLSLGHRRWHEHTGEELSLIESFASHAAIAIDNARLFADERARRAQVTALLEINTKIGAVGTSEAMDPLLTTIAQEAAHLLGTDNAGFRLVDGDDLVVAGLVGTAPETMLRPRIKIGESLSGRVVAEGRTLVAEIERSADALITEHLAADRRLGYTHFLGVPLRLGDRIIGVLSFRGRCPFLSRDQELAEAFAGQAAVAIEHARLYSDASRHARRMAALADLGRLLAETLDPDVVARRIAASVCGLLEAEAAGLYRVDVETGDLQTLALSGEPGSRVQWNMVLLRATGVVGLAVQAREPFVTANVLADPRLGLAPDERARVEPAEYRALLALPLVVEGRVIGGLAIADRDGRVFRAEEIRLAQAFADQAALALENARLFALETSRRTQIETLAEIGRELTAELSPDRLLRLVAERAGRLFAAHGVIYLLEDERTLVPRAWSPDALFGRRVAVGHGLTGLSAEERRAIVTADYGKEPYAIPRYLAMGLRRVMAHPLMIQDRLLGVITMSRRGDEAPPFTREDLATLETFAVQAAIALENTRLHEETGRRRREAEELARLARTLTESLEVSAVGERIVESVLSLFGVAYSALRVVEPGGSLRLVGAGGEAKERSRPPHLLAVGQGMGGRAVAEGRPVWTADVLEDPTVSLDADLRQRVADGGERAILAVPLSARGHVTGVLLIADAAPRAFTEAEMALAQAFADQAALALENARLYAETSRRLEETRALLEVAEILNSTLDPRRLLKRVAIRIAQVCRVDRCSVLLWEDGRIVPLMSQFADGRQDRALWERFMSRPARAPRDVPAHARAIETRRPVLIHDTAETDLIPRDWIETYGIKSYMVVPLVRQDEVIGVLSLDHCARATPFAEWQTALAMAIGGQLALALENTRLYSELSERLRETTTLLAVGRVLSEPAAADELMRRVGREVAHAFGADMVGTYALDPAKQALVVVAGYHVPPHLREMFLSTPIALDESPALLDAWRGGRAVWTGDAVADSWFSRAWAQALPPCSLLFAPTSVRGEPVGALCLVWWRAGRVFPPAEVRLVEGVAAQVGLALANAELARQTQAKLRETETLLAVSRSLSSTLELQMLMRHFLRQITAAIGSDAVGIWMLDDDGESLRAVSGYRIPRQYLEGLRRLRMSTVRDPFYAEAAQSRRPVFARDAATDPRIPRRVYETAPHRSQLFVPIVMQDRLIGGFVAAWFEVERDFSAGEIALLEAIASQAGVAIENARLFEQNRRQVQELSVLHDLSRAVTGELDREALIAALHAEIARVFDPRHLLIALHDAAGDELELVLRVRDGVPEPGPLPRAPATSAGLMSVVLATGLPIRTDDYVTECERRGVSPASTTSARLGSWLGVPMTAGGQALGVIVLRGGPRPFTAAEERMLFDIAQLAALALRSASLFNERARAYDDLAAAQDQLVRTEKLRALGEMASGVAHDFNNLLAAILGRAQLLLRRLEDPQLRQWVEVIERSAQDGAQTIRRLQEFTRVRRDTPLVPVDLNRVVREALEITQSRWQEESLRRGVIIESRTVLLPLPAVEGDQGELREAMTNLILNAVDAMPAGGTLTLATAVVEGEIEVTVTDTGVGMSESVRERIFDPFFTTKGPQGTGLGLSMTYGILTRHGARISVESEEGRGSTFRLRFARAEGVPAAAGEGGVAGTAPVSLRCLVVDDEQAVGEVIGDVLASEGHGVVVLTDGAAAIERFRAEPFDVVFTDLAMPGVSGWQVARAVKAAAPSVPVFVVTGYGVELSPEARRERGVEAVFSKPLRIADIVNAVEQVARNRPRP